MKHPSGDSKATNMNNLEFASNKFCEGGCCSNLYRLSRPAVTGRESAAMWTRKAMFQNREGFPFGFPLRKMKRAPSRKKRAQKVTWPKLRTMISIGTPYRKQRMATGDRTATSHFSTSAEFDSYISPCGERATKEKPTRFGGVPHFLNYPHQ